MRKEAETAKHQMNHLSEAQTASEEAIQRLTTENERIADENRKIQQTNSILAGELEDFKHRESYSFHKSILDIPVLGEAEARQRRRSSMQESLLNDELISVDHSEKVEETKQKEAEQSTNPESVESEKDKEIEKLNEKISDLSLMKEVLQGKLAELQNR